MNVLIFNPDAEKLKILAFYLESALQIEVDSAPTLEKAMSFLLADKAIDLIVVDDDPATSMLFKYLLSADSKIPIIIIGRSKTSTLSVKPELVIREYLTEAEAAEGLPRIARQIASHLENDSYTPNHGYCRISVELLLAVVPLAGDIFVRLSNVKYVKIFNAGVTFTEGDLARIWNVKKLDHLYIEKRTAPDFVKKLQVRLLKMQISASPKDPKLFDTISEVHKTVQELSTKIGFTPEVMALTKMQVEMTVKMIGSSPRLSRLIEHSVLVGANYSSSHSILVAHVACCIAAKMNWPAESTFNKLILASFMHDITMANPELAKIRTRDELRKMRANLTDAEITLVENHPFAASDLVNKLTEIPSDVYLIVQQHHEKPDGSGFPRGLRGQSIAPLAAVFIVAHEMVELYCDMGDAFDVVVFWERRLSDYDTGTFKKIARAFFEPSSNPAA
jgi:hypothetical protein